MEVKLSLNLPETGGHKNVPSQNTNTAFKLMDTNSPGTQAPNDLNLSLNAAGNAHNALSMSSASNICHVLAALSSVQKKNVPPVIKPGDTLLSQKLDQLIFEWLSLSQTQTFLKNLASPRRGGNDIYYTISKAPNGALRHAMSPPPVETGIQSPLMHAMHLPRSPARRSSGFNSPDAAARRVFGDPNFPFGNSEVNKCLSPPHDERLGRRGTCSPVGTTDTRKNELSQHTTTNSDSSRTRPKTVASVNEALSPPTSPQDVTSPGDSARQPLQGNGKPNKAAKHFHAQQGWATEILHLPQLKSKREMELSSTPEVNRLLQEAFADCAEGMTYLTFEQHISSEILRVSKFVAPQLFKKIDKSDGGRITLWEMQEFWNERFNLDDPVLNLFNALKDDENDFLWPHAFEPVVQDILDRHPGLEFLKSATEFQKRYLETVIPRIMYVADKSCSGKVYLEELRKSNLYEVLEILAVEQDVNNIQEFFSYEHFYVIYCKFWELDEDHDFKLDRQDFLKYDNHAFSARAVDRIFTQVAHRFTSECRDMMSYDDFIWFLINDEDKTTDRSLEYWFRLVDLDGDGVIRDHEMMYFYDEQIQRLESLGQEVVTFPDLICQMNDMINPKQEGQFRLCDFKRTRKVSGTFFNCLLSLTKFVAFEQRDPFAQKQDMIDFPDFSEWSRFCKHEYDRIAADDEWEEGEEGYRIDNEACNTHYN